MENGNNQPPLSKEPYDPAQLGLDPGQSEVDQAIVAMSQGDAYLAGYELARHKLEEAYRKGTAPFDVKDQIDETYRQINLRRRELGLPPRPLEI